MGESVKRAVFLSYASQDATAVARVCVALRHAGVEVWFDQSELVGGDAWDAKIRRQIKECALFVPVISAETQRRREGYFRIEWKLAAQRTHGFADGTPFLLPVVIDETHDEDALVPEEFRAVQWTHLAAGDTPEAFCARVKQLLAADLDARSLPPFRREGASGTSVRPTHHAGRWLASIVAGAVVIAALAFWRPWRSAPGPTSGRDAVPSEESDVTPLPEARRLVAKARQVLEGGDELNRENYFLAEDLLKRAVALDPAEASAWALYAQLSHGMIFHHIDSSEVRRDAAKRQAERARALAPRSTEVRIAVADVSSRLKLDLPGIETDLLDLSASEPKNWRVQRSLGLVYRALDRQDEAIRAFERARDLSHRDPVAGGDLVNVLLRSHRHAEAEQVLAEATTHRTSGRLRIFDLWLKSQWRGDLAASRTALESWPDWLLTEDRGAIFAWRTWQWSKMPDKALAVAQRLQRDYLRDSFFTGPRAVLTARTHEDAGNTAAAQADWRTVVQLADRELAASPNDVTALYWKAWAQARLGDAAAAGAICTQLQQRNQLAGARYYGGPGVAALWATVGRPDLALEELRNPAPLPDVFAITRAVLEFDPAYNSLRADPRFQDLLASALAPANKLPAPPDAVSPPADAASANSIAVLAFANLSDDKANEYFSDGISEELLNLLAKIPGLKVSARTSSFYFKGRQVPLTEIARQLGVAYVVEGSVRRAGEKVRITVQLIKAEDGFHVWSENFDRELNDIFAVQDEIAGLVAKNLSLKLGIGVPAASAGFNPEAYRFYLEGRQAWNLRNSLGFFRARVLFSAALALEPDFARAMVGLADVADPESTSPAETRALVQRALQLEPSLSEAHATLGLLQESDWDFAGAEKSLRRAVELNPNNATAHQWYGRYLERRGLLDPALASLKTATTLDPFSPRILDNYACLLLESGDAAAALAFADRVLDLQSSSMNGRRYRAGALWRLGRREEAIAEANWVVAHRTNDGDETSRLASALFVLREAGKKAEVAQIVRDTKIEKPRSRFWLHLGAGQVAEAVRLIDEITVDDVSMLLWHEMFDALRAEPGYLAYLRRRGLEDVHARAQRTRAERGLVVKP